MIIDLDTLFPQRLSLTDLVSYSTDHFASIESKIFASLPADVECGDVVDATGALYTSGADAFVVVSEFVTAGSNKAVNVLRSPAGGSLVCIKSDNLTAADGAHDAAVAALAAQGFQMREFFTS
ncbi:hypothetical protein [Citrobacter portucalensis]|uniref:hypothetical protein n=1 Tax=Citrobacter portucalensis TaxID=1639133 RepID=UPI00292B7BD3|nr:hypothetical protein [Citrobacter portucalensis]MDV0513103.1 hypothetical protein [Citrobacter portucalensis]MDV0518544.1 hypothetical protein [Citrobacter portucalensis]MDV0563633.1 hypothetical protein [Citrobacter portucalensis]MEB0751573.1 hypothetical protein [Citrobacter portucalensis]MEB0762460.1 hypothetical protein [Citrobacter portucalensis]